MNVVKDFTPFSIGFTKKSVIYGIIVLLLSLCIYFFNYQNPPHPYWDENYHVASAEKYIEGVFFLEPHPPLGKLFIALGEVIINPNENIDKRDFVKTDYIKNFPDGYSFAGVRFFPALFGALSVVMFFLILLAISKNSLLAFVGSSLYLFDNAILVHFRGAMVDGIQMFFILSSIWYFFKIFREDVRPLWKYLILGALIGLAVSVKFNALILLLLFVFLLFKDYKNIIKKTFNSIIHFLLKGFYRGVILLFGLVFVFLSIQYIHMSLSTSIVEKDYDIGEDYKTILDDRATDNPMNVFFLNKEWMRYSGGYTKGVPRYDYCKEGENGSLPLLWPFGNKTISYRWNKDAIAKEHHSTYFPVLFSSEHQITLSKYNNMEDLEKNNYTTITRYLYLQGNPVIWFLGLLGVLFSFSLIISYFIFGMKLKSKKYFSYIVMLSVMYVSYMFVVFSVGRVLYLYHYFIPLVFSLIMAFCIFLYIFEDKFLNINNKKSLYIDISIILAIIVVVFVLYLPFAYYLPLTPEQFEFRNWFEWWKLTSA